MALDCHVSSIIKKTNSRNLPRLQTSLGQHLPPHPPTPSPQSSRQGTETLFHRGTWGRLCWDSRNNPLPRPSPRAATGDLGPPFPSDPRPTEGGGGVWCPPRTHRPPRAPPVRPPAALRQGSLQNMRARSSCSLSTTTPNRTVQPGGAAGRGPAQPRGAGQDPRPSPTPPATPSPLRENPPPLYRAGARCACAQRHLPARRPLSRPRSRPVPSPPARGARSLGQGSPADGGAGEGLPPRRRALSSC